MGFDLRPLPQELLPYVPFFGRALLEIGTETEDYVKFSQRILRKTGGVSYSTFLSPVRDDPEGAAWFLVSGKATVAQTSELLDILRDMSVDRQARQPGALPPDRPEDQGAARSPA